MEVFDIRGGYVVVEDGVADAICAYEGAEEEADEFCEARGLALRAYHLVDGWDAADGMLDAWKRG